MTEDPFAATSTNPDDEEVNESEGAEGLLQVPHEQAGKQAESVSEEDSAEKTVGDPQPWPDEQASGPTLTERPYLSKPVQPKEMPAAAEPSPTAPENVVPPSDPSWKRNVIGKEDEPPKPAEPKWPGPEIYPEL